MREKLLKILFIFTVLFTSCDPVRFATGYVYDKETNMPLKDVDAKAKGITFATDSIGKWDIIHKFGINLSDKMYNVKFNKSGYVEKEINLKNYNDSIIYLERE